VTAAWPHIRAAQTKRDRFAAYLCDEAATEAVRAICAELDWPLDKIETGGLRTAVQSLSVMASPSILLVDLSDCTDPLRDINALAEVCEPGTIVIAAGQVNDVRLYRDLISSGLQDYLLKPFHPDLLRDALKHAFLILTGPRPDDAIAARPHKSITVTSARGGCGASMVATALADNMASQKGLTTALLDLDVHFGTAALSLNLEPGRGLSEAILNPTRIDGLFLERAMVAAGNKLSILSAEASLNQPILSDGTGYRVLQDEVKNIFECTIRDTPRDLLIYNPELLADVPQLVIVSELTLACTRDVYRLLHWLKSTAPRTEAHIVLNKVAGTGLIELTQRI
jgi:pilus assembly protein CpaE